MSSTLSSQVIRQRFLLIVAVWGLLVAAGAGVGLTQAIPTVLVPLPIVLLLGILLLVYSRSATLQAAVADTRIQALTIFHAWRIPAGMAFLWYGAQGQIPGLFALLAGWGDIAAGGLAIATVAASRRGSSGTRRKYIRFHLFGMLDFVVAVGTGLTFSVLGNPLMVSVTTLPLVLIVFWGVPVTGALGIATLHRLIRTPDERPDAPAMVASGP